LNSDRPDPITSLTQVDEYDRLQHDYSGLPGSFKTTPTLVQVIPLSPLAGVTDWIVQTIRATDLGGDLVFINRMGAQPIRIVLPAKVTAAIARQHEALTSKARSRAARDRAPGDASHLHDPKVRAKALATRKAKAAKRRARKARAK
jgi:hypothetical protein